MEKYYKQILKKLATYSIYGILVQCMAFAPFFAMGAVQEQQLTVTGKVTADDGSDLPGVSVVVKGTNLGTITNADGTYTINVPDGNATLIFSFVGYVKQEVAVSSQTVINIAMEVDSKLLNEVVIVAYGTQQKVTLTGAVSGIKGAEMTRTKNENPQNMLTGRVAGVRVWQTSAEPGSYSANFDIRGMSGGALFVIDGVPRTVQDFQRLNASDIDDISVLKDASAAIYGVRAASGVVLVTTKKGTSGKTSINYNGSVTMQKAAGLPRLANPYQTMTLYNEKAKNIDNPNTVIYGPEKFEQYRTGELRSADWNSLIFSDYSPQTQHDLSISGGNEKTQYFIGGGYMFQEGFFKSGDMNYRKYNVRTNITTEIAEGLSLNLNLAAMFDQRQSPYSSAVEIIRNYWRQGVLFPAYADPENTMLSYEGLDLQQNTVAMMTADVSGYRKFFQKDLQSSAALSYDFEKLSPALKGFSAKAMVSFDYRNNDNNIYRKEYYQYAYDEATDSYISSLYAPSSKNQIRRETYQRQQALGQFLLNYKQTFATDHNVTGLLGWESQVRKQDNYYAQNDLAFAMEHLLAGTTDGMIAGQLSDTDNLYTIVNKALFGRLNYTFADRYIAEFQFRYDGSSKFVEDDKWGFFPSGSIGWRLSEEPFFKNIDALGFVDQLKFRASYGLTANDGTLGYDWYGGYLYPLTSGNALNGYYNQFAPGYMYNGAFVYGAEVIVPNRDLTWWRAKTFNVGVDFQGWNGLFGFSLDYFDRRRTELPANANGEIPTVVGTGSPLINANSDQQFGLDLELNHRNRIGELSYGVKAIATITRNKYLTAVEKGPWGNSYDRWRNDNLNNRYQGVQFGYESDGRYMSWEEIWDFPLYKDRDVLPGDYKYEDWNGDGEISALDEHPYAYDQTPWLNFSMGFDAVYKNFDVNFLFQGTAMGSMQYQEPLYGIWGTNGGGTLEQYTSRWHPIDASADLYNPETEWTRGYYAYTGRYPIANSDFNRVSTAYLRLKSVELGYTLPQIKAISSMSLRVFANAYNLFTITKVKFVDPEHPDSELGRLYPLNKTFTLGVNLKF